MRAVAFTCAALAVLSIPSPGQAQAPPARPAVTPTPVTVTGPAQTPTAVKPGETRAVTPAPFRTINTAEPPAAESKPDAAAAKAAPPAGAPLATEVKGNARSEPTIATSPPPKSAETTTAKPAEPLSPVAEAPPKPKPKPITLAVAVDLKRQQAKVTINGELRHTWPISSGRTGYDTPNGSFKPQWAAKLWHSKQYDDAPMPHSVFFNGGIAFHGTTSVRLLGRAASHGCIRLAPTSAATLYELVHKHGYASTRITVEGQAPAPAIARREGDFDRRIAAGFGSRGYPPAGRGGYAAAYPPGYYSGYGYYAQPQRTWPGDPQPAWGWSNGSPPYAYGRRYN